MPLREHTGAVDRGLLADGDLSAASIALTRFSVDVGAAAPAVVVRAARDPVSVAFFRQDGHPPEGAPASKCSPTDASAPGSVNGPSVSTWRPRSNHSTQTPLGSMRISALSPSRSVKPRQNRLRSNGAPPAPERVVEPVPLASRARVADHPRQSWPEQHGTERESTFRPREDTSNDGQEERGLQRHESAAHRPTAIAAVW